MNKFSLSSLPENALVHFIGIGGISMSALAEILLSKGYRVSGSDRADSNLTDNLKAKGAEIYIGQCAENIKNPDLVVFTAAIGKDNPEFIAANKSGAPVIERPILLGAIMKEYKFPVAVSGTHGKTTTTSMLTHIFLAASLDPTVLLGGELTAIGGNLRISGSDYFVCEACEYHESFLSFFPFVNIILNVEEDHLDYFTGLEHIIQTFRKLVMLTPDNGCTVVNGDDKNALSACEGTGKRIITVGIKSNADYVAKNISFLPGCKAEFDVYNKDKNLGRIALSVPGEHNILNALTVIAVSLFLGIEFKDIQKGLSDFCGVHRRFEFKGEKNGVYVIDDYAHHPTEITASLSAAKSSVSGKIWCIFQPHTYTRTHALFDDFTKALSCGINVIITDIFSAREKDTGLVSSKMLAEKTENALYIKNFEECVDFLNKNTLAGDTVITMGAGDVYKIGDMFLK